MLRVAIVGGGAIGSAVAFFLGADPDFSGEITVVERDPTYARASSALSASSIRQQFSAAINIEIGRFGIEFLRRAREHLAVDGEMPAIGLVEPGYLFLATAAGRGILERNHRLQRAHGVDVALLDVPALAKRFPFLAVDDLAAGSLGVTGEGWFDGYALLQAFRRKARALGARYVAAEAVGFVTGNDRVKAVRLGDGSTVPCDVAVNAAGPWARSVASWVSIDLPVRARRRSVFVFTCAAPIGPVHPAGAPTPALCPLVIDPSGVWFRPEGRGQFICGASPDAGDDPDDAPLDVEHALFEGRIWPALAARVPAFEAIRQTSAWAGYYEMNVFDANGIVGPHPGWPNLLFANGFSGHGIQQSPAVGRGIADLIVHGGYRSLDLAPLAVDRILDGRPLVEENVV